MKRLYYNTYFNNSSLELTDRYLLLSTGKNTKHKVLLVLVHCLFLVHYLFLVHCLFLVNCLFLFLARVEGVLGGPQDFAGAAPLLPGLVASEVLSTLLMGPGSWPARSTRLDSPLVLRAIGWS